MPQKKKEKSIKSVWKARDIKIVFSEPDIQEGSSVVYINDISEIMYYYYTMTVYKYTDDKWRKEFAVSTYDFPGILSAKLIIEKLLQSDYCKIKIMSCVQTHDIIFFVKMNNFLQYFSAYYR